jgi:hypothetical protein
MEFGALSMIMTDSSQPSGTATQAHRPYKLPNSKGCDNIGMQVKVNTGSVSDAPGFHLVPDLRLGLDGNTKIHRLCHICWYFDA